MCDFESLKKFVEEMRATTSSKEKLKILEAYKDRDFVTRCLLYCYDPYRRFGVTSARIATNRELQGTGVLKPLTFWSLLDNLCERKITGHDAIRAVLDFIEEYREYEDLIFCILDKDLKLRADAKLINKAFLNWIPEFKVALSNEYDPKRVNFETDVWYGSRKLDGVRCICVIEENGHVVFYSRSGLPFYTLGVLQKTFESRSDLRGLVFDGEICIVHDDGVEDFQSVMKEIRKKNHTIESPKFYVFDVLHLSEFTAGVSDRPLKCRLERDFDLENVEILRQEKILSEEHLAQLSLQAEEKGYEGIMLRKNVGYKGKRSNDLLKVKKFKDGEYEVLELAFNNLRFVEDGKDVSRETLSAVTINHKGHKVSVGSGFSKEQREYYYNNPDKLLKKTITVRYFGETQNQEGGLSLRFPTLVCVHGDVRLV